MEAAGDRIAVAAEFPAGMEDSQDDFDSGLADLMHGYGDTTAIIDDSNAVIFLDRHFDVRTISGQGFVDTVIDDFVDQMMKPRVDVLPMYIPGRLRTASKPSNT